MFFKQAQAECVNMWRKSAEGNRWVRHDSAERNTPRFVVPRIGHDERRVASALSPSPRRRNE